MDWSLCSWKNDLSARDEQWLSIPESGAFCSSQDFEKEQFLFYVLYHSKNLKKNKEHLYAPVLYAPLLD